MESIDYKRALSLFLSVLVAALVTFLLLSALSTVTTVSAQADEVRCLDFEEYNTLEKLIACIHDYMPHRYSVDNNRNGFDVPTPITMTQWRQVVSQMMTGECDIDLLSGYDWRNDFTVTTFTDTESSNTYCVFMETTYGTYPAGDRVTHGWGTFIYNPTALRELNISAPHPISEKDTAAEAVGIFKNTQSRTFLMAGAHRRANSAESDCQPGYDYMESDAAHNITHTFHATVEALKEYYGSRNCKFYHLQFHGMESCCNDCNVHLSHGSDQSQSGDKIWELRGNLLKYHDWDISVPGDGKCNLNGTKNVQGRLLNGVPSDQVCDIPATGYSGYFIHIEQCPNRYDTPETDDDYRDPNNWFPAINDTSWGLPCLIVTKQGSPNPVSDGQQLTYTIQITNTGTVTLTATITDILPQHVTPTDVFTWTPITITAPGGVWTGTVSVTVTMGYTGPLVNRVRVTTKEGAVGTARATGCANTCPVYLPVVLKKKIIP